jgi:hypothetical protein
MNEERKRIGFGYVAIAREPNKGWRIELENDPSKTPNLLRSNYWSLAEASEAVSKYRNMKLNLERERDVFGRFIPDTLRVCPGDFSSST